MQVETYECQETMSEPLEASEEAIKIIEELELSGQQTLIAEKETVKTRCPYRKMRPDERFVYTRLCPTKTDARSYSSSPVPLRALQILHHALSLDFFKKVEVWSAEGEIKDPVLVAYEKKETWRSDNQPYILARWAEELDAWPILVSKAKAIWAEKAKVALARIKVMLSKDEEFLSNDAVDMDAMINREEPTYFGWS